jgi:hypothetical protein
MPPAPPVATAQDLAAARQKIARADVLLAQQKLLDARGLLHEAMTSGLPEADLAPVRTRIDQINQVAVFSGRVLPTDPDCLAYVLQPGDMLRVLARRHKVGWRLLKQINGIANDRLIRAGWRIKIVRGPFHVVVRKRAFRMAVYLRQRFVCQFPVGLGSDDSTPAGRFVVKDKLVNPPWTNPRTGQIIRADDPQNPLGEHWIGLRGAEEATKGLLSYGIHGTIEPGTIGKQASMGCVRMFNKDVERLFAMLVIGQSTVTIVP